MALTIYILEDDEVFRSAFVPALCEQLKDRQEFKLLTFAAGPEMLRSAGPLPPDLIFADIALEGDSRTGIDYTAELITLVPGCEVIYISSYLNFATDIYETRPLYFILKEEYHDRLPKAMQLFFRRRSEKHRVIQVISDNVPVTIRVNDIMYCEHLNKNTMVHCADNTWPVRCSLAEMYAMLPDDGFTVCHKSFIIGHAYVRSYIRTAITLTTGEKVPIGRTFCDDFRQKYSAWLSARI